MFARFWTNKQKQRIVCLLKEEALKKKVIKGVPLSPLHIEIMLAAPTVCRYRKLGLVWGSQQVALVHPAYVIYPCENPNTWHKASHLCRISIPEWGRGGAIELPIVHGQVGFTNGWTPVHVRIGAEASCVDNDLLNKTWSVELRRLGPGPYCAGGTDGYRRLLEFKIRNLRCVGPIAK